MKKEKFVYLVCVVLSLTAGILTATPNCVHMRFMGDPAFGDAYFHYYYSGFSMMPVGYAIWGAMAAGVGSIALAVLGLIGLIRGSCGLKKWMLGIAVASLVMSLTLLMVDAMTVISGIIAVLLAAETVFLICNQRVSS